MDDEPRGRPLTDEDLERIRRRATQMVGWTGLSGEWSALTWDEVKGWDAISAQDALGLVDEVERLRFEVRRLGGDPDA